MSVIVGVHGIGQQLEGRDTQEEHWRAPLISGIRLAGGRAPDPSDVGIAFYGDVFRKSGSKRFGERELTAADVTDEFERDLLTEWAQAVVASETHAQTEVTPPSKVRTPGAVQECLRVLSRSKFFAGAADRVVIWNLQQVRMYFTDAAIRATIQRRVEDAIGPDTRLLVGHSLGSVVAYEAIAAHPDWPVRALVTLGSPLGIRRLVFDRLIPPPVAGRGSWPGSIMAWTNVCDRGDAVALIKELGPLFGAEIHDVAVNNGAKAHDVRPYLTARETGAAIAAALEEQA
jgi:hypothetical protein